MADHQHQPFRKERRRGYALTLLSTARILEGVLEYHFKETVDLMKTNRSDYNLYNHKEQLAMEKCVKMMLWQIKALRAVARSMQK